jgi:2-dehydropantoate 2-reductase
VTTKIAVFGAGAIGCWVGGRLAAGGAAVTLIGRARVIDELRNGLRVSELGVPNDRVWAVTPALATDASAAAGADLVLVTVKSAATADAGRELAAVVSERAVVASLQNGVRNAQLLRDALPGRRVLAGMVPFNVVRRAAGEYHRGTSGTLMIEASDAAAALADACRAAELPLELRDDMPAVQWGKLVMNLNNAINALSGVPLMDQLSDRDFRRCLAAAQREALALLRAANQPIARLLRLPPSWIARLLPMPDAIFRRVATRIASVDPHARSSMWDDLEAGRTTEVDYIQGEIVALADKLGADAPVNRALVRLVKEAERGGRRDFSGRELLAALSASPSPEAPAK